MRASRVLPIVAVIALAVAALAGSVVGRARGDAAVPAVAAPTIPAPTGRPAAPAGTAPGTTGVPADPLTASQADSAAAASAGWPYAPDVGGTPHLASALERHLQQVANARQPAAAGTAGTTTPAGAPAAGPADATDPATPPAQRSMPHTPITSEFYHPTPPPRREPPRGSGWPEAQRQPAKADG